MFGFEKIDKTKTETTKTDSANEPDNKTILQKVRDHAGAYVGPVLSGVVGGVVGSAVGCSGTAVYYVIEKNRDELKTQSEKANQYLINNNEELLDNESKFINKDFISDVALSNKTDENTQFLIRMSALSNNRLKKCCINENDSTYAMNDKLDYARRLYEIKVKLKPEEKKAAKEQVLKILSLIKTAKADLARHINSDDYLNKLALEMNISVKAAREHQKVRLQNINNLNFCLQSSAQIDIDSGHFSYAYCSNDTIYLPYDIDLIKGQERNFFVETLKHEILHGITRSSIGLSEKVKIIFEKAFKPKNKDENSKYVKYFSDPDELIVRKQLLDQWMQDNNFKEYDEQFTPEHYKKLLILEQDGKLPENIVELIDHIDPEAFSGMMNELAELEKNNNDNYKKDYYHADWNYGTKENKT